MSAGPAPDVLEKLRQQTVRLLDQPDHLCPEGGRVLTLKKIGSFSARRVVHYVETGTYPTRPISPTCGDELCVDCGRASLTEPAQPEPLPFDAPEVVAAPPPVPVTPAPPVPVGRALERVEPEALDRRSRAGRSSPVPDARSTRSRAVAVAVQVGWRVAVVALAVVLVVVLVQAVGLGLSNVGEVVPDVDVRRSSTTSIPG